MHDGTCAHRECNATFPPRPGKKYCSTKCKKQTSLAVRRENNRKAMPPHCLQCAAPIPATRRANAHYCSATCSERATTVKRTAKRRANTTGPTVMRCTRCDTTVEWKPNRKYCPPCAKDSHREAKYRGRVAYKHRIRNLRLETIDPLQVHKRDQWTCSICHDPIDPTLKYPHQMSASIDHVIPLSRGGTHSPENVASAHLDCNVRKGNRIAETTPTP